MGPKLKSILAAVVLCGWGPCAQAAEKITAMYTASAPYMLSWIAKDQGFFAKHGLDVDLLLGANGNLIVAAMQSGSVQVGTPTIPLLLQAVENGLDQVAIAGSNAYPDPTKVGLAARADLPINSPKDIAGKIVGVSGLGGFLDVMLRKWLTDNDVDTAKVRFVEVSLSQTADALRSKSVDLVASVDPFLSRAIASGAGHFVGDYTETLPAGTVAAVYSVSRAWATAHPADVSAFQEGLLDALAYVKAGTHTPSVLETIARYTKLPPDVVSGMPLPNVVVAIKPENIAFWATVTKQQGLTSKNFDTSAMIIPLPKQ